MKNGIKRRFSKGYRKYVRMQKSKIRREVLDPARQKELINELYKK